MVFQRDTDLDENNGFKFDDVRIEPEWCYIVSVKYDGVKFTSKTVQGNDIKEAESVFLPVTIFSSTDSDEFLSAERVHIFVNFSQTGTIRLTELYTVTNSGDHVIIPSDHVSSNLQFTLPTGAINLQIQNENSNSKIIKTNYGFFELVNIFPLPAQHQILYRYDLPYENEKRIRFIMPMDVETLVLAIPFNDVELESNDLLATGTRMLEGELFQLYMVNDLKKGEGIAVNLSGKPGTPSVLGDAAQQHLLISIVFFVPILIVFFIWLINNHQKLQKKKQRINDLAYEKQTILDEIVALDDLYRSNQLAVDVYQNRRNELLIVLKEILKSTE